MARRGGASGADAGRGGEWWALGLYRGTSPAAARSKCKDARDFAQRTSARRLPSHPHSSHTSTSTPSPPSLSPLASAPRDPRAASPRARSRPGIRTPCPTRRTCPAARRARLRATPRAGRGRGRGGGGVGRAWAWARRGRGWEGKGWDGRADGGRSGRDRGCCCAARNGGA